MYNAGDTWIDGNIIGTRHELISAYGGEYTVTLNMGVEQPLGCFADNFIHVLYLDKDYYWYEIRERRFCFNDDSLNTEGEVIYYSPDYDSADYPLYSGSYDTLMINQYTFENESAADIYLAENFRPLMECGGASEDLFSTEAILL